MHRWVLDGFPRSAAQAMAVLDSSKSGLRPDCVILLERPTELMKEFLLGRMTDSATGETYHPRYHPVHVCECMRMGACVWVHAHGYMCMDACAWAHMHGRIA